MMEQATATKRDEPKKERNPWEQYEARKAELDQKGLSPSEYFNEVQKIADEVGV